MWKRKELKSRARQVVKKNYWTAIVICFLIALLTGEFGTFNFRNISARRFNESLLYFYA